jgi:O-antigen ligase
MRIDFLKPTPLMVGFLCGLAIPSLVFGRAVLAVPLMVAVLILPLLPERGACWRAMIERAGSPVGVLFLIVLALWLPSMYFSPLPLRSFEAWARVPIFVGLITLLWALLSQDRAVLTMALKTVIVAGAVSVVFALSALTFLPDVLSFIRGSGWSATPYEGFRPPNLLKAYAGVGMLLVPVLVWAGRSLGGRWQMPALATAIGLVAIVWLTYNRSAVAGLFAMLIVVGGFVIYLKGRPVLNVIILAVFAIITIALMLWLYERRFDYFVPEGAIIIFPPWLIDFQRQTIWAHAIDMAMRSPWFGNGINAINLLPGADMPLPRTNLHIIPSHPHNWLIEVFAETGAIGALALLTLVVTVCLKLAVGFLKSGDTALFAALLVNVGYWSSGLLNVSFWSAWWQISYLMLTALCLAGARSTNTD